MGISSPWWNGGDDKSSCLTCRSLHAMLSPCLIRHLWLEEADQSICFSPMIKLTATTAEDSTTPPSPCLPLLEKAHVKRAGDFESHFLFNRESTVLWWCSSEPNIKKWRLPLDRIYGKTLTDLIWWLSIKTSICSGLAGSRLQWVEDVEWVKGQPRASA